MVDWTSTIKKPVDYTHAENSTVQLVCHVEKKIKSETDGDLERLCRTNKEREVTALLRRHLNSKGHNNRDLNYLQ